MLDLRCRCEQRKKVASDTATGKQDATSASVERQGEDMPSAAPAGNPDARLIKSKGVAAASRPEHLRVPNGMTSPRRQHILSDCGVRARRRGWGGSLHALSLAILYESWNPEPPMIINRLYD